MCILFIPLCQCPVSSGGDTKSLDGLDIHVIARMLIFISSPSLAVAGKHVKRHARRAEKRQADFDWLNPHSLGTIPTFDSIANLT